MKHLICVAFSVIVFFPLLAIADSSRELKKLKITCATDTIAVKCSKKFVEEHCGRDVEACAARGWLGVSEAVCKNHDLSEQRYTIAALDKRLSCGVADIEAQLAQLGTEKNDKTVAAADVLVERLTNCAALMHEAFHACSPFDVDTHAAYYACNEFGGLGIQSRALTVLIEQLCKAETLKGSPLRNRFCAKLCVNSYVVETFASFTSCICEGMGKDFTGAGEWLSKKNCCNCHAKCVANNPNRLFYPEICNTQILTDDQKKQLPPTRDQTCSSTLVQERGYNCSYMSEAKGRYECK